jgi:hypothetical protein
LISCGAAGIDHAQCLGICIDERAACQGSGERSLPFRFAALGIERGNRHTWHTRAFRRHNQQIFGEHRRLHHLRLRQPLPDRSRSARGGEFVMSDPFAADPQSARLHGEESRLRVAGGGRGIGDSRQWRVGRTVQSESGQLAAIGRKKYPATINHRRR